MKSHVMVIHTLHLDYALSLVVPPFEDLSPQKKKVETQLRYGSRQNLETDTKFFFIDGTQRTLERVKG